METHDMSDRADILTRCHVAAAELGMPVDAVVLVRLVPETLTRKLGPAATSVQVSAAMLCEGLLRCEATHDSSKQQLVAAGVHSSECVGRIVAWLAQDGIIRPRSGESAANYHGIFDFGAGGRA